MVSPHISKTKTKTYSNFKNTFYVVCYLDFLSTKNQEKIAVSPDVLMKIAKTCQRKHNNKKGN